MTTLHEADHDTRRDVLPPVVVTTVGIPEREHLTRPTSTRAGFPWAVPLLAALMLAIGVLGSQSAGARPTTFVLTPASPFQSVTPLSGR